jgi:hypothetical protein
MKRKTEMEKLMSGLANVRRRSGNMQKLATQEVYYLRKIVVLLQLQQRYLKDSNNIQARKILRLQRLVSAQRSCIDAMQTAVDEHCKTPAPKIQFLATSPVWIYDGRSLEIFTREIGMAASTTKRVTLRELQSAAEYLSEAAEDIRLAADLSGVPRLKETADMVQRLADEIRAASFDCCG